MKTLILTVGSRGDVQPYVALGAGLRAAGHSVTLATMEAFAPLAAERGLGFAPVRGEFLELIQTPEGKAALAGKGNPLALLRQVQPMLRQVLDDATAAAEGAELIVYHPKAMGGHSLAEKLGIPGILALPLPLMSPTAAFPSPILPVASLGPALNRMSHSVMVRLSTASVRGLVNRWRRETLGLPPARDELTLRGRPVPRLYGYSPAVVPTPADWGAHSVATGYWFLDPLRPWQPPAALAAFLEAGPPPVYVGFGSMAARDAARTTRTVVEALERAGQRGVLATGYGGLAAAELPASVHMLDQAPHDWLFPRMAAVVHHGGAGTTGAGLRAGVPTVICPFFGDQPFWGRRVAELGAGPRPIPQRRLTAEALAGAIAAAVGDPAMRARAAALGETIRAEDGVARAVALIEAHVAAGRVTGATLA
ncbi:MAG TPA: glycosyltransferase [Chloroflexaceae bacterium]|nr:glycosyltransferase [Chloroflexaceae bacterium]